MGPAKELTWVTSCCRAACSPYIWAKTATAISAKEGKGRMVKKVNPAARRVASCFCHLVKVWKSRPANCPLFIYITSLAAVMMLLIAMPRVLVM